MSQGLPQIPAGSGEYPIAMVALSANETQKSSDFYSKLFGWSLHPVSATLVTGHPPGGPRVTLRGEVPADFQGAVPFVGVPLVDEAMVRCIAAGAELERPSWRENGLGVLARFRDKSGTIYGLTDTRATSPRIPAPFGANPKPPAGTICSVEMYAEDGNVAAGFFRDVFGWGASEMMPTYMGFDPGAGIGGVFQSHTPGLRAVAYVYVDDVHAKIAAIEAAGGERMGDPSSMPGMATFGYFKDPSGTPMGLIGP
jgi:uncharacterized protein